MLLRVLNAKHFFGYLHIGPFSHASKQDQT